MKRRGRRWLDACVKLIVGLGNPGPQYVDTRHNVGFDVIDVLASRNGADMAAEKFNGWFAMVGMGETRFGLLKPKTYMNRSGRSVLAAAGFYKLEPADLLVISDDMALPVGRLRMRTGGSSGGHNGLQDIIERLGTDQWCRLRIGIGPPIGDPADYVLSRFTMEEQDVARRATVYAADAAVSWMENGADLTMTRYNGDPPGA
jgi:PTH1 family peptidyl-tRNA hydrolase